MLPNALAIDLQEFFTYRCKSNGKDKPSVDGLPEIPFDDLQTDLLFGNKLAILNFCWSITPEFGLEAPTEVHLE